MHVKSILCQNNSCQCHFSTTFVFRFNFTDCNFKNHIKYFVLQENKDTKRLVFIAFYIFQFCVNLQMY